MALISVVMFASKMELNERAGIAFVYRLLYRAAITQLFF